MNRLQRIFVLFILLLITKVGSAQTDFKLQVDDLSFEELIDHLETKLSIKLAYNSDLRIDETFSFNHRANDIKSLLEPVWEVANLECQYVTDRQVLIRPMPTETSEPISYRIQVKDLEGNTPLNMVAIAIAGTNYGTYTKPDGTASLTVDANNKGKEIIFYLLGHHELRKTLGEESVINIRLQKSNIELEEILIEDSRNILRSNTAGLRQELSLKQLSLATSGIMGTDILRSTQLLPGISAHNDRSAGLQIRGSDEDQALIIMDGIPIYNPTHYFSVFSAINSSYIDQASVYKNNLPIEYGGKTSGMLQLQSDNASDLTQLSGTADINLLTSSLVLKIPVSESVRLFLNGRTTYNNVSESGLAKLFSNEEEIAASIQNFSLFSRDQILSSVPDYKFNDWNAKLQIKTSENHLINLNFYSSNDKLNNSYSNTFENKRDRRRIQITENFDNTENWSNLGASLNVSSKINDSWSLNTNAYFSRCYNDSEITTSITTNNPYNPDPYSRGNFLNNYIDDLGTRIYLSHQSDDQWNIKLGVDYSYKKSSLDISGEQIEQFSNRLNAHIYSGFGSAQLYLSNGWTINAGIRSTYFSPTDELYFSPRVNVAKSINKNFSLKASAGRQYQFAKELSFETPQGRTQSLWVIGGSALIPVNRSNNFMWGGIYKLGRFALDIEGFYRTTHGVNEYAFFNSQFVENIDMGSFVSYRLYSGINKNYGADFSLSYSDKTYSGWIAYTLSKGTYSFKEIAQGSEYPSQEDRRHQLKLVNNVNLKKFEFSVNVCYSSGRPYTDLVLFDRNNNRHNINPRDRQRRLPYYFRLDTSIDFNFLINNHKATIGVSIFNLTNRNNVNYLQYIFSIDSKRQNDDKLINTILGTETNLLPQTINLNLSYKF